MNKRTIAARLAVVAATAPLAVGLAAGTASAETITLFEGCYGASSAIVCDGELTYTLPYDVESYQTTVPVCAGTCTNVPVTLFRAVSTGQPLAFCVTRTSYTGVTTSTCFNATNVLANTVDTVEELADSMRIESCDWWEDGGFRLYVGDWSFNACVLP